MSEFKSDGNGGYLWNAKQAEFQGYMRAKIEDIERKHADFQRSHSVCKADMVKRTDKNKQEINNQAIKSAAIGGGAGLIGGFLRGLLP